ncbi:hypothetical protein ACW9KT_13590 [Hymenobacter sp. HD11105]
MLSRFSGISNKPLFWFLITTLLFGIHTLTSRFYQQVYDSGGYWLLANIFNNQDGFSLFNFNSSLRGYLLPLVLSLIPYLTKEFTFLSAEVLIKIFNSVLAGVLFGIIIPTLWQKATKQAVNWKSRLLLIISAFLLWRDYFNYILSDFPAVVALGCALILLLPTVNLNRALLAGLLVAAATNIRPIYVAAFPFVALLIIWLVAHQKGTYKLLAIGKLLFIYCLGFILLCIPQWLINYNNFHTNSPLVIGIIDDPATGAGGNLYLEQITAGFSLQKYETSIAADYPVPQVRYYDAAGANIISRIDNKKIDSYTEYILLVFRRPLDIITLNARHLFNGLDVLYPAPYIFRVYTFTSGLAFFNYTMLFFASVITIMRFRYLSQLQLLLILPIIVPSTLMLPLPMECRYLMPVHLLLFSITCFGWPKHWTWQKIKEYRLPLVLVYLLFISLCYLISANTQMTLGAGPKLLS